MANSAPTSWAVAVDTSQMVGLTMVDFGPDADLTAIAGASVAHPAVLSANDGNQYTIVGAGGGEVITARDAIHRGDRVAGTVWSLVGNPVPLPAPSPPSPPMGPPAAPPVPPSAEVEQLRQLLIEALPSLRGVEALSQALVAPVGDPHKSLIERVLDALALTAPPTQGS